MHKFIDSVKFKAPAAAANPSFRLPRLAGCSIALAMLFAPGCDDPAGNGQLADTSRDTTAAGDGWGDSETTPDRCETDDDCAAPTPTCDIDAGVCVATEGECLMPAITLTNTRALTPFDRARLLASLPGDTGRQIARWEWSVTVPNATTNMPPLTSSLEDFAFETERAGEYEVALQVWDDAGIPSCEATRKTLTVLPDQPIWVELVWHTPSDADETDEGVTGPTTSVGTDLDLHFLHPDSEGQWFHPRYDCHSLNHSPTWNDPSPQFGPSLTLDDTNGAGPEVVHYDTPQPDTLYRVGVHYHQDSNFGSSLASLRVYIYGELKEEWTGVELAKSDFWDALTIEWPSQVIKRVLVDDQPSITHGVLMPGSE